MCIRDRALDSSGNVYVADYLNNRVVVFTPSGTLLSVYGQGGSFTSGVANYGGSISAGGMNGPYGIALDASDNLYVTDTGNNRILVFASGSTTATRVYGQGGDFTSGAVNSGGSVSPAALDLPAGLTLDGSGGLFAADFNNNRVLYYPLGSTTAWRVYGQY